MRVINASLNNNILHKTFPGIFKKSPETKIEMTLDLLILRLCAIGSFIYFSSHSNTPTSQWIVMMKLLSYSVLI